MKRLVGVLVVLVLVLPAGPANAAAIDVCPDWFPLCHSSTNEPWNPPDGTYEDMLQETLVGTSSHVWQFDLGTGPWVSNTYSPSAPTGKYLEAFGSPAPALVAPAIAGRITAMPEDPIIHPAGRSIEMNPSNGQLRTQDSTGTGSGDYGQNSFTLRAAVQLNALPTGTAPQAQGFLFHRFNTFPGNSANSGYYVAINPDGSLVFMTKAQGTSGTTGTFLTTGAGQISAGARHFVTVVFEVPAGATTGTGKIYVDDVMVGSLNNMQRPTEGVSRRMYVGVAADGSQSVSGRFSRLNGVMDEVMVMPGALTGSHVTMFNGERQIGTYGPDSQVNDPLPTPTTIANPSGVTDSTTTDRTLADRILGGLSNLGNVITSPLRGIYNVLKDGLGWIGGLLQQLEEWLAQGFNAVVNAVQLVVDKLTNLPGLIWDAAYAFFVPTDLDVPAITEFTAKFPASWVAEGVEGAEALVSGVNGGMAASCGPEIGAPAPIDIHFTLNPSSSGCPGTGPGGARTPEDNAAGNLWGYRPAIRGLMSAGMFLALVWWGIGMLPWVRDRDLPLTFGVAGGGD